MKKGIPGLGPLSVIVGIILSKMVVAKYGGDSRTVLMAIIIAILISFIIAMVFKKQYIVVLYFGSLVLPLIIMAIGMYLDRISLVISGLILILILIFIMIKIIPKFKKD